MSNVLEVAAAEITFAATEVVNRVQQIGFTCAVVSNCQVELRIKSDFALRIVLEIGNMEFF